MNSLRYRFGRFGLGVAVVGAAGVVSARAAADLTGAQVLERCKKAYGALKSYQGTSTVVTKGDINWSKMTSNTSARIKFVRPGKIRVDGTLMSNGRFEYVCDGKQTWERSALNGSKWEKAASTEMAIAGFTGVSQGAATTIPSILLNTMWGNSFGVLGAGKLSRETVNGRAAYRVEAKNPMGSSILWIDRKTFLLVKKFEHHDLSKMKMPEGVKMPAEMPKMPTSGVTDTTETFTEVRVNEAISASTFGGPAGVAK